jgi:hypothetical protein
MQPLRQPVGRNQGARRIAVVAEWDPAMVAGRAGGAELISPAARPAPLLPWLGAF